MSIIGCVDDSTCMTGGDPTQPVEALLSMMQDNAQLWSDLLWCSGGKLELPKCGYHVIYYDFESNGIPKMRYQQGHTITLNDSHGEPIPVTPKNVFKPRKNLGHFKAPAGTSVTQHDEIMKKARSISNAIMRTGVTRDKTRMLYELVYRPAIEYTIPQSFLTKKQLSDIEKKNLPKLYVKCGYNRNTARAILQGPKI